ncbi:MAG: hypothetical protein OEM52_03245 [bacterium]|nr:hypothetical protein [bacterium]
MRIRIRSNGGFTFIEMAATMGMAAFALIGFTLLWAGVAKQEDSSWSQQAVDGYGNFVLARLEQDFRNAYKYDIGSRNGYSTLNMHYVDYKFRSPDTINVIWVFQRSGDAIRTQYLGNQRLDVSMFKEYGWYYGPFPKDPEKRMYLDQFRILRGSDIVSRGHDYGLLDSAAVQVEMTLRYQKIHPHVTVNEGNAGALPPTEKRSFSWKTMLYLKNFHLYRLNLARMSNY